MIADKSRIIGIISEKNHKSEVIACNYVFAEYAGLKSVETIIGLTDCDLPWNNNADLYLQHEQDALTDNNYTTFAPLRDYKGNDLLFMHTKLAKKDAQGGIIGVSCRAVEIIDPKLQTLIQLIRQPSDNKQSICFAGKLLPDQLTPKQAEILFYLSQGKKAKLIAHLTNRSVRTIEHHIENLKIKLNCRSLQDLMIYAVENKFYQHLPHDQISHIINALRE